MGHDIHPEIAERIAAGASVRWNELPPTLVETALAEGEGRLAAGGALAVTTGIYTGRSVKDKFIVRDAETEHRVWWDNSQPMTPAHFELLLADMLGAMTGRTRRQPRARMSPSSTCRALPPIRPATAPAPAR